MFQKILFLCCFLATTLVAQVPQFNYNVSCDPGFFDPDPFIFGEVLLDGSPTVVGMDSFAIFDAADQVIISGPIQTVTDPSTMSTYTGFGIRLNTENGDGCAGYTVGGSLTVILYDASFAGCGFHTAANSTFTATIDNSLGTAFIEGPDGDASTVDVFDFSSTSCVTALPVEFSSFSARPVNGEVLLNWTTGEEINNSHFEVQTSVDGRRWENIGTVNGVGNSVQEVNYSFTDIGPSQGLNLYRIKQVDFDGAYAFSGIANANIGSVAGGKASIYPNPIFDRQTTLSLEGQWSNNSSATLVDFNGRKLATFNNISTGSTSLDLPQLPSGVYQLIVTDAARREVIRMVVRQQFSAD